MRRLQIEYETTYEYAETVTLLPHKLLLRLREGHGVRIELADLTISPAHHPQWQRDVYDNAVAWASFDESSSRHPAWVPPVSGSFRATTPQSPRMQVAVRVMEIQA